MSDTKNCPICKEAVNELTKCKSCGRDYCDKCQSPSTHQNFCKECVAMEGMISKD